MSDIEKILADAEEYLKDVGKKILDQSSNGLGKLSKAAELVKQAYLETLERPPDYDGGMHYVGRILSGEIDDYELYALLANSDEGKAKSDPAPEPVPDTRPPPQPSKFERITEPMVGLLLSDYNKKAGLASFSPLLFHSDVWSDEDRTACIARLKKNGCNTIDIYVINQGDFSHVGNSRVMFAISKAPAWIEWHRKLVASGLEPTYWLMGDDSQGIAWDIESVRRIWAQFFESVGMACHPRVVVLGLEAREYWDSATITSLSSYVRAVAPADTLIAMHGMPMKEDHFSDDWVDLIYAQHTFWKPASEVVGWYKMLADKYPDKGVVMAEYSMAGETASARAIGSLGLASPRILGALCGAGEGGEPDVAPLQYPPQKLYTAKFSGMIKNVLGPCEGRVASWPVKIQLESVNITPNLIHFNFTRLDGKPMTEGEIGGGAVSVGNLWLIDPEGNATTIDYLRPGQYSKLISAVHNGEPYVEYSPGRGKYGMFVSSLARNNYRTDNIRSNIIEI